jgi:hypothetical protein
LQKYPGVGVVIKFNFSFLSSELRVSG